MSTNVILVSPNVPQIKTVEFDAMSAGSWYKCVDAPIDRYVGEIGIFTIECESPTVVLLNGEMVSNEMYEFVELKAVTISYEE